MLFRFQDVSDVVEGNGLELDLGASEDHKFVDWRKNNKDCSSFINVLMMLILRRYRIRLLQEKRGLFWYDAMQRKDKKGKAQNPAPDP